jgi:hypothetical protein
MVFTLSFDGLFWAAPAGEAYGCLDFFCKQKSSPAKELLSKSPRRKPPLFPREAIYKKRLRPFA